MNNKEMIKGVKEAINRDGVFPYEWGRDKPLSDQLCLTGYTLGAMCLLGEIEIAKRLMKGLLWMEKLTGKSGYLPRSVYYGDKEFDCIKRVFSGIGKKEVGIWNDTSQDQYLGLFFGLHYASKMKDINISHYAIGLEERVKSRLRVENYKIINEEGKNCKHGKLNRFFQHIFFPYMEWTWRDKLTLKLMPLMKLQDTLKRIVGKRLNRSNYHMMLCGLYLISQHKPEFKKHYKAVYNHVKNEENALFNAMYNSLTGKDKPVKEIVDRMTDRCQYISKSDIIERDYIVPTEDRPFSHWAWKEDPYMEQADNAEYTNRYGTHADGLLALAIQNKGIEI